MKLTQDQANQILAKINDLWKQPRRCPMCNNDQWSLSDTIFEMREFNYGNFVLGGESRIFPVAILTCHSCGNSLFFNAIGLGVVQPPKQGGQSK